MKNTLQFLLCLILITACTSNDDNNSDNFDRSALLTQMADNQIIPAYQQLSTQLNTLESAVTTFTGTPNASNLSVARTAFLESYRTWQFVEMFNIGLAEQISYANQVNIYPTNITDIQNNIANTNVDLSSDDNNDAVGFPAIDYLLYGTGATDTDIIAFYTTNPNATNNAAYINALTNRLKQLTNQVLTDWQTTYRADFTTSTTNTATSALNKMVNDYIYYYEKGLRANKVGIPTGVFSGNPGAQRVEAFYSKNHSRELLLLALEASQDFYNGMDFGDTATSSGVSLADYVNERTGNTTLTNDINAQFNLARTTITNNLGNNLSDEVTNSINDMRSSYDELQKVVILLKTDMLQALNINVDYVDADGD